MQGHHHTLTEEFPEHRETIHRLKMENAHFQNLMRKWEEIDKQIARAESRIDLMSEEAEEQLKRSRVALKDEIGALLRSA